MNRRDFIRSLFATCVAALVPWKMKAQGANINELAGRELAKGGPVPPGVAYGKVVLRHDSLEPFPRYTQDELEKAYAKLRELDALLPQRQWIVPIISDSELVDLCAVHEPGFFADILHG